MLLGSERIRKIRHLPRRDTNLSPFPKKLAARPVIYGRASSGKRRKSPPLPLPLPLLQHNSRCRKQFRGSLGAVRFPADCMPTIVMSLLSPRRRRLRQLGRRISPGQLFRGVNTPRWRIVGRKRGVKRMCTRSPMVCVCVYSGCS